MVRICAFLMVVVLAGALCTSASAIIVHTQGYGDACIQKDYYYSHYGEFVSGPSTSYTLNNRSAGALGVNSEEQYMDYGFMGYSTTELDNYAVMIFEIAGLSGKTLSANSAKLWFDVVDLSGGYPFRMGYTWFHGNVDLGPDVTVGHGTGSSTEFSNYAPDYPEGWPSDPIPAPGWLSINVTQQIQQDINRGFSYSTFMFHANMIFGAGDGSDVSHFYNSATIGASEGGNGAYLAVPEPGSIAGLLCGLGGLAGFARRKRH